MPEKHQQLAAGIKHLDILERRIADIHAPAAINRDSLWTGKTAQRRTNSAQGLDLLSLGREPLHTEVSGFHDI